MPTVDLPNLNDANCKAKLDVASHRVWHPTRTLTDVVCPAIDDSSLTKPDAGQLNLAFLLINFYLDASLSHESKHRRPVNTAAS
jgi:hypothetical protein